MDNTLFLGRQLLDGDPEKLRRLLRDHTACDHAATALLLSVERARREGAVSYGVVYPRPADPGEPGWKMRFGYDGG